jgi:hypothetical protein
MFAILECTWVKLVKRSTMRQALARQDATALPVSVEAKRL